MDDSDRNRRSASHHASGGGYGLGMIGAAVFYIQQASSFGDGLIGLLKACVWPAFVVYHLMDHLNM